MVTRALFVAGIALFIASKQARAEEYSEETSSGDAQTNAAFVIADDGDRYKITTHVRVKKTGLDGSAWGYCQLVGLDESGETVIFKTRPLGRAVGARFPQGVNHETDSSTMYVRKSVLDSCQILYVECVAENKVGIPRSIGDLKLLLKENLKEYRELVDVLVPGSGKEFAGGTLFRRI